MANHAAEIRLENPGRTVTRRGRGYIDFDLGGGITRHVATVDPLHIRDSETEIDTAFEQGDGQPYYRKMVKADYNVYAGLNSGVTFNAGQIIEYRQSDTGTWIRFQPQDLVWENEWGSTQYISSPQGVAAQVNDDTLYWPGAYGAGRNFRWRAETRRLRKDLILDSLAQLGAPPGWMTAALVKLRLQFLFEKSSGVQIWCNGALWDETTAAQTDTPVEFRQGDSLLWYFEPGVAYDAAGAEIALTTRLLKSGGVLYVEVVCPWSWLQAAAYPVYIDPTLTTQPDGTAGVDTWLEQETATDNFGTNAKMTAGAWGNPLYYNSRALIKFDLSTIPADATINSATLSLWEFAENASQTNTFYVYKCLRAWVETQATWNIYSTGNNWTTAGCGGAGTDYNSTAIGSRSFSATEAAGEKQWSLSGATKADLDAGNGWIIRSNPEADTDEHEFRSSDYSTAGERPKLVVDYTEAGGGGRTTKNTDARPLGIRAGISRRVNA